MKQGRTLEEVMKEIEEQSRMKEDFIVDTRSLVFTNNGEEQLLSMADETYHINDLAHGQIAEAISIPTKYYNRMRDTAPELLEQNVNHWFQNNPTKRLIRTIGTDARAFLSDRYRRLDNEDLMEALLPVLSNFPGMRLESCEVTPHRFYIKAVTESLMGEVSKGDVVYGGVVISNSEVGRGKLRLEPLVFRLVCLNGMIVPDYGLSKFHIGRVQETDDMFLRLTDETIAADDKAFWLKARDLLASTLTEDVFGKIVGQMKEAKEDEIEIDPVDAVVRLSNKHGFSADEHKSVLSNLLRHEEPTKFGMSNAITRTAQEVESYERATELEYLGAEIMSLPKIEWKGIAGKLRRQATLV